VTPAAASLISPTSTRIPAAWVAHGYGVPNMCSRHGEPAIVRRPVTFISAPPPWSYPLFLLGVIPFLVVVAITRRSVTAAAWPFCVRCRRRRISLITMGSVLFAWCVVELILAISLAASGRGGSSAAAIVVALLTTGMSVFISALIITLAGTYQLIAAAELSRKGAWVQLRHAHPEFAQRAAAAVGSGAVRPGRWP
jgi:hypothetical protein